MGRELDHSTKTGGSRLIACRWQGRGSEGRGSEGGGDESGSTSSSTSCIGSTSRRAMLAMCSSTIARWGSRNGDVAGAPEVDEVRAAGLLHQEGVGGLGVVGDVIAEPLDGVVGLMVEPFFSDNGFHLEVLTCVVRPDGWGVCVW